MGLKLPMESDFLERYSRNIILREIGGMGQKRLSLSKVLIIGAGGLGTPAMTYLVASGVGKLGIVDYDTVSLSNLQRQVLFGVKDIGKFKVDVAKLQLSSLNPNTEIVTYRDELSKDNIETVFNGYDLILDGTDNYPTRYLINSYCFKKEKPLLFGAISQWDGQVGLYDPKRRSACFECLFPEQNNSQVEMNCSENGVFGPLVGIIGALMAAEAVKFITRAGRTLTNELILYDALSGQMRRYQSQFRLNCKVCSLKES